MLDDRKIEFLIPIRPKAWQRAGSHKGIRYTPKEQRSYQDAVKTVASVWIKRPLDCPVSVQLGFVFRQPKRMKNPEVHAGRPDIDNLTKNILDALNGIAYLDDGQVFKLSAWKGYGDEDKVIVTLLPCPHLAAA